MKTMSLQINLNVVCCFLSFFFFLPAIVRKHGTTKCIIIKLAVALRMDDFDLCKQQRLRPACAFAWPDHSLCYSPEIDMDIEKPTSTKWRL